jgi:hypothetical protein
MTRAFGGSRPVGPVCEFHYRIGRRRTQYDGVLGVLGMTRSASGLMRASR